VPNVNVPNFIKHTLLDLKTQIDPNTVIVGDFSALLSPTATSSRQKNNKETLELSDTIDPIDLTDVYSIFHPEKAQYTFFSVPHGTFSKIDQILEHKTNLNKCKKIKITPCIQSDHKAIKRPNQQKEQ
jgi:exonuclease III